MAKAATKTVELVNKGEKVKFKAQPKVKKARTWEELQEMRKHYSLPAWVGLAKKNGIILDVKRD